MKILNFALITAFIIFLQTGIVNAQDNETQAKKLTIGAGIDIESLYLYDYFTPGANLILDFDLLNSIRIEPEIGFQTQKNYDPSGQLESERRKISYGSGLYGLIHFGNASTYFGLKYVSSKMTVDRESSGDPYSYSYKENCIGPVVGLEYKFAKRFSIGGEFDILHIKSLREEIDPPSEEERMSKGWKTGNSIKFRFYFN